ncbi:hypothetical protein SAMN04487898_11210 [Pedobacter sp. ok626]|nr:hypothetical protein SAMN04487898_11210 [Pedobacter sp. ok626]
MGLLFGWQTYTFYKCYPNTGKFILKVINILTKSANFFPPYKFLSVAF